MEEGRGRGRREEERGGKKRNGNAEKGEIERGRERMREKTAKR